MHREDNSKYLLYIEPKKEEKSKIPIDDHLKNNMGRFRSGSGFKGFHTTDCGEKSTGHDYLLENGMITNSLSIFYLKWYRQSIPQSEMEKLNQLVKFYEEKGMDEEESRLPKEFPKRRYKGKGIISKFKDF